MALSSFSSLLLTELKDLTDNITDPENREWFQRGFNELFSSFDIIRLYFLNVASSFSDYFNDFPDLRVHFASLTVRFNSALEYMRYFYDNESNNFNLHLPEAQTWLRRQFSAIVFHAQDNQRILYALGEVGLVFLLLVGLAYAYTSLQRRRQRSNTGATAAAAAAADPLQPSQRPRLGSSGSLKRWRSTRDRTSSFDFFGMNHDQRHSRSVGGSLLPRDARKSDRDRSGTIDFLRPESNRSSLSRMNSFDLKRGVSDSEALLLSGGGYYQDGSYLYDEFGIVTLSFDVVYYGPSHSDLRYSTWTPPTSWKEASRRILPHDIMTKLQREISLNITKASVSIEEPESKGKWDFSLPVEEFSTHVIQPAEGGVMNLYVKGSSKEEWMEYTFETAALAAQFQLDLLAYQVFGRSLYYMYQVLCLVQQGSTSHKGQEFVLHDENVENDDSKEEKSRSDVVSCGLAWDDAMRALSTIPSVRIALERLWLHHKDREFSSSTAGRKKSASTAAVLDKETSEAAQTSQTEEYVNKRLLLGPVDFFRLFVPSLPETAVPQSESDKSRMEQLLRWRKRVARAAVLVRSYTLSRRIANQGWTLPRVATDDGVTPLIKRLAYDDHGDNNRRDKTAKNEYYEATVSRDVLCHVRPDDYFSHLDKEGGGWSERTSVLSPYQAYTLVGAQMFLLPPEIKNEYPLHYSRDPISAIPSLRDLIASHPEHDFFITTLYPAVRGTAVVVCYTRSLPKGIDPKFDNVVSWLAYCPNRISFLT
jgi:hypothetical protein